MSLAGEYEAAVAQAMAVAGQGAELLPSALVGACAEVLVVEGAGLSLTQELRVPLSASSAVVATAERLQVTLGEGPCLSATDDGVPLVADLAALTTRWPVFGSELVRQTPFRSVASLPLRRPDGCLLGAVDLYSHDERGDAFADIPALGLEVASLMSQYLTDTSTWLHGDGGSGSVEAGTALDRRLNVWVAVGMVIARTAMTNVDALAVLRAYAFGHDLSLDDLAERVTTRDLEPDALFG
jgi:hypothetical protein